MRVFVPVILLAALASWGVAAQQEGPALLLPQPDAAAPANAASVLEPQRQGDISFVSGGSSEDDRATLQGMAANYNMRLMFAVRPSGEYLADIAVTLVDASGKTVLDTVANGPLFYAAIPPGRYRVTVANDGQSQTRSIDVAANGVISQSFYWPQSE
jgi:hypothetical protein